MHCKRDIKKPAKKGTIPEEEIRRIVKKIKDQRKNVELKTKRTGDDNEL